jgi:hypothetical protein
MQRVRIVERDLVTFTVVTAERSVTYLATASWFGFGYGLTAFIAMCKTAANGSLHSDFRW